MKHASIRVLSFALPTLLGGCFFDDSSIKPLDDSNPDIASAPVAIRAKGSTLSMGDTSAWAKAEERPIGMISFDHDYVIDATEVPRHQFASLLGWVPGMAGSDRDSTLPVSGVSWFDAALYCNARSKRDGLDTVYSYSGSKRDASGSTWELEGLSTDLSRDGWRLPTESEWEFAARAGTGTIWPWGGIADSSQAERYAWFQKNSDGKAHPVGTLLPNAWGLHDMAGNVMEWVNDWKGDFPARATDYAGPLTAGIDGGKPIKGGSFRYGLSYLRPSSRSATYTAVPGSTAPYVGFRCARGTIPGATFGLPGGSIDVAAPTVHWSSADVTSLFAGRRAKLAFVQIAGGRRVLCWIDFGEEKVQMRQFPSDSEPVFHPVVSPDGRWVAWSTVLEGTTKEGRVKVRRLDAASPPPTTLPGAGAIPRWWIRPGTADTFLVVASTAAGNATSPWKSGSTRLVRFANGSFGPESLLTSTGSYHDGRSADGRYLATGSTLLRRKDLSSGRDAIQFVAPHNGKSAGDTSQVCNVSIAPDSSGDVLGLDFGARSSSVVGRAYGIHEIAFRIAPDGRVRSFVEVPAGEASFEDMEWSNDPRFAVTATLSAEGLRHRVWAVDLASGRSVGLVSGKDLWQPSLWIDPKDPWPASVEDSAGAYNTPPLDVSVEDLANKLVRFWIAKDSIEVVALGSSHTRAGFLPGVASSFKAFNLSASGGPLDLADTLLTNYVLPHAPKLKFVVLEIEPGWHMIRTCDGSCALFQQTLGLAFDRNHGYWVDSLPERVLSKIASRTWPTWPMYDAHGGFPLVSSNGWGADVDNDWQHFPDAPQDTTSDGFRRNMAMMERMISVLRARGVRVLAVNYPQSPRYASSKWAGRHDPEWDLYRKVIGRIASLEKPYPNFRFYDAHLDGRHDYDDSDAHDYDHLSSIGARKLSARVDSILSTWK